MDHDETGCQAPPEGPSLCINNCGFFGSKATMNMCSKCHKDMILKQEQAQFAASSIENLVNASPCIGKEVSAAFSVVDCRQPTAVETKSVSVETIYGSSTMESGKAKTEGPKRCSTCKKRVGLTGYNCRCGNLFCGAHRYSDKHNCPYDYRTTAQDAIARANPIVKAEKLDKI